MGRTILLRLAQSLFSMLMVTVIIFGMVRLTGDPLSVLLPEEATEEMYEQVSRNLGLDRPVPVQYITYLGNVVQGDFGISHRTRRPVTELLANRFPATLELSLIAILLTALTALPLGIYAGYYRGGTTDALARGLAILGQSMPQFWLGLLFILVFAVTLGWFPAGGHGTWQHVVLPAVTLSAAISAGITRLMRSSMLEVLESDYIRFVRGKGMTERRTLWRHGFRNAAPPVLTFGGLMAARLMTGSIVTESVFAWPGLGRLVVEAIQLRDFPVVQGAVLFMSGIYITVNFFVDVLYVYLNPRLRA